MEVGFRESFVGKSLNYVSGFLFCPQPSLKSKTKHKQTQNLKYIYLHIFVYHEGAWLDLKEKNILWTCLRMFYYFFLLLFLIKSCCFCLPDNSLLLICCCLLRPVILQGLFLRRILPWWGTFSWRLYLSFSCSVDTHQPQISNKPSLLSDFFSGIPVHVYLSFSFFYSLSLWSSFHKV